MNMSAGSVSAADELRAGRELLSSDANSMLSSSPRRCRCSPPQRRRTALQGVLESGVRESVRKNGILESSHVSDTQ